MGANCHPLRIKTEGGVQRVNCANTEGQFRIIQSIPSPKAKPFKRWLAQVGYERAKEIENPELASTRPRELYQANSIPILKPQQSVGRAAPDSLIRRA